MLAKGKWLCCKTIPCLGWGYVVIKNLGNLHKYDCGKKYRVPPRPILSKLARSSRTGTLSLSLALARLWKFPPQRPASMVMLSATLGLTASMGKSLKMLFHLPSFMTLVAKNVTARGLDINDVQLIIQCEPPRDVEAYTHQSGRTGRADNARVAVMLLIQEGPISLR